MREGSESSAGWRCSGGLMELTWSFALSVMAWPWRSLSIVTGWGFPGSSLASVLRLGPEGWNSWQPMSPMQLTGTLFQHPSGTATWAKGRQPDCVSQLLMETLLSPSPS